MNGKTEDLGKLLLRLAVGGLMLFHGIAKLQHGIHGIEQRVIGAGLPTIVAYGVYLGEIVAPVFMILGVWTRLAGLVVVVNMVVAIALAHSHDVFKLSEKGGAWAIELPMFYLVGGLAVACLGAGRFSVTGGRED